MIFSKENRTQQIRIIYAVTLLLSFFSRYSVALGHDCNEVNLFTHLKNNREIVRETAQKESSDPMEKLPLPGNDPLAQKEHCERHRNHSGAAEAKKTANSNAHDHHNHSTCPICVNYVTIDKISVFFHAIQISIHPIENAFITVIPQLSGYVDSNVRFSTLPRGPPLS